MKKILVIEDTPAMRELIVDTLSAHGYECLSAEDGLAGVEAARRLLPDLVICDIHMPRMDGYGVLEAIRSEASMSTPPFVFLTPFSIQELIASVTAQFEKQATIQRQADQRLEELRGNITMALPHELRTPLNGILGLASMLLEDGESMSPHEVRENLQFIHQSANRLHRLIENFLVYSQIELMLRDPSQEAKLRTGDSVRIEKQLDNWAAEVATARHRTADLRLNMLPVTCAVPAENLKKIFTELLDNALKFSNSGQLVSVEAFNSGKKLVIRINDEGRGFSPDQIARVGAHMQFDRKFYEQQGAGLGLIIAKRLTELHGGRFAVESEPMTRTSVSLELPA
jgi:two-component system, sensor histidine kinase and response regulator